MDAEGSIGRYLEGFYLLCPFYRACMEGIAPGCYRLSDVAPDHFRRSEYFLAFYQHARLEDERKCLVAQYMLRGHSVRSLAERLGISEDTLTSSPA
ncbi:MAG: LuxR family transcriptional regulator [Pseudomonas sp.]|jgi:DNA-binding NarL/FixJ family response regulator|nr:LuxR family transcriptional regulator [Pseudomonas sp.]